MHICVVNPSYSFYNQEEILWKRTSGTILKKYRAWQSTLEIHIMDELIFAIFWVKGFPLDSLNCKESHFPSIIPVGSSVTLSEKSPSINRYQWFIRRQPFTQAGNCRSKHGKWKYLNTDDHINNNLEYSIVKTTIYNSGDGEAIASI